jgi:hypothetical protein
MLTATSTTMLRPADQAYLDEHFVWDATVEGGMVCVTIAGYSLAAGLTPAATTLLVRLPSGFPDVAPDMFWLAEPATRSDGTIIPATDVSEPHLARTWQRWSRHIAGQWRPGTDDLRSYMAYIRSCVQKAAA